jgi:hypothetical protein
MPPLENSNWATSTTVPHESAALAGQVSSSPESQSEQSYRAFLRDLPGLLREHAGKWAAYTGERRLAIGDTRRTLHEQCLKAGYPAGAFLICGIAPRQAGDMDELLDV